MKNKAFSAITVIIALTFGFSLAGCSGADSDGKRERVKITFDIGYEGGTSPKSVTISKGTQIGDSFPADPTRNGFKFLGWYNGDTRYTRNTLINKNVTLTARWEEIIEVKPQPSNPQDIANLFDTENGFPQRLSDSRKIWGMNNPVITFAYLADPVPMVYCHANPPCIRHSGDTENSWCEYDRLYMYGSNDTLAFRANGTPEPENFQVVIQGLRVISTADLVNWTDHGPQNLTAKNSTHPLFPSATEKVAPYADETWAPSAEWKIVNGKPKFFLYWCNSGDDTSVVVSDEGPLGPFYNPGLTASMINRTMPNATSSWLFDPGTMIDSDGTGYIVLGGGGDGANPGNARRAQLADSMYAITGNVETYNAPYMFEASDIWKWNDIYYLNYTTNWQTGGNPYSMNNICVAVMMNTEGPMAFHPTDAIPRGDWGAPKNILPNGSYGDNTNHASLFDYKGVPYIVYHTSSACQAYGVTRLRVAHLAKITMAEDGTIDRMTMGVAGVEQVGDFNPYDVNEAETMAIGGGIYTKHDENASNSISVASIDTGDWLGLYGVNFDLKSGGANSFNAVVKLPVTGAGDTYIGAIEIRIDPEQQGITNPSDSSRLGTSNNAQTRITGGTVIGRVQLEVKGKEDEGKWINVKANLPAPVTGKHNLAFVFYSSTGEYLETHTATPTPATDGRARNVGFEIDRWWFE